MTARPRGGRLAGTVVGKLAGLATVVLAVAAAGCKKDQESLVVVTLSADAADTTAKDMTSVVLTINDGTHSVAKTFALPAGTGIPSTTPYVSFGVYVDSDFTGGVTITATASQPGSCLGETGTKGTKINSVGAEAPPVTIGMKPDANVCTTDGGAGGTLGGAAGTSGAAAGTSGGGAGKGGTTGAGGMAGATGSAGTTGAAGTSGAAGTTGGGSPPTLVSCIEINHDNNTSACSDSCSTTDDVAVYGAAFSPKNSQLFVTGGTDGRVKVWQVSNGTATATGKVLTGTGLGVLAFSPDGTLLAVGRVGGIEIWNVANWTLARTLTVSYEVYGVAFSPDSTEVISFDHNASAPSSGNDSTLYVHAVGTLTALHTLAFQNGFALAVSPVGAVTSLPVAVSTLDGEALVYTLTASGFASQSTLTVTDDGSAAETIQFSPQGTLLASGGDDGLLHFWTVPTSTGAAPTSPDIDIFDGTIFSTETYSLAFWPTGNYIAVGGGGYADFSGSGSLTAWEVASPRAEVGTEYDTTNSYDVVSVAVAPDASFIIGGEGDCGCVIACRQ
jgi:hypothetical protein